MRRLFRFVNTAPWPAAVATALLMSSVTAAVVVWPMLLARDFQVFAQWATLGPVLLIIGRVQRRRTGSNPDRDGAGAELDVELIGRLRRGYIPDDPDERHRISRRLTADLTQARTAGWVMTVGLSLLAVFTIVLKADDYPGRLEWVTAAWFLLITAAAIGTGHRLQDQRRQVLRRLSEQPSA